MTTSSPTRDFLDGITGIFADYVKPSGAIHQELGKDSYTLQMVWDGFQVMADVTPVVNEALNTSKISAEGRFRSLVDELILKFAYEIVRRHEKMDKKEAKMALRQTKVLRLAPKK